MLCKPQFYHFLSTCLINIIIHRSSITIIVLAPLAFITICYQYGHSNTLTCKKKNAKASFYIIVHLKGNDRIRKLKGDIKNQRQISNKQTF